MSGESEPTKEFLRIVSLQLGVRAPSLEANLREDLGVESIDFQNLLAALEDAFAVQFEESEVADVETLQELLDLVGSGQGK